MKRIAFNDDWYFRKQGDTNRQPVILPHDAMIHERRQPDAPGGSGHGYFPGGVYIYEKTFTAPAEWENKAVFVEFEGIYKNSCVSLNGVKIGGHPYGYTGFAVELTGLLYGGENTLTVAADNSMLPNSRWYSGSGIYRPVNLIVGNKTHIRRHGVKITTLSYSPARIRVDAGIAGAMTEALEASVSSGGEDAGAARAARAAAAISDSSLQTEAGTAAVISDSSLQTEAGTAAAKGKGSAACEISVEILDGGRVVASGKKALGGSAGESAQDVSMTFDIPDARLWSDESPNLYACHVTLWENGRMMDEATENFGIRKIEWSPRGLFVNGRETLLRGGCIHHDNGILGAAAWAKSEERRVRMMKGHGFNAIRSAHNPASTALVEACDRYGMYLMDETFDMWYVRKNKYDYGLDFKEWWKEDTKAMVERDYNHPSVILYSIGNEVSEPGKPEGVEQGKEIIDLIKKLDPSRAVTGGMNLMIMGNYARGKGQYDNVDKEADKKQAGKKDAKDPKNASLIFNMMAAMVGPGMNKAANSDKVDRVTTPILDALDIAGYNYASGRYGMEGTKHPDRVIVGSETFPYEIYKNWEMVEKYPYLIGDFMWTAWDYLGEAGIGAWSYTGGMPFSRPYPWILGGAGVIDILGNPDASCKYAEVVWGQEKNPVIGVRPVNHPGIRVSKSVWRGTNAVESWSWSGCDGNRAEVEVYAKAASVELLVNGKAVGRKKLKEDKAFFKTKYRHGSITAIAYDAAGRELGRSTLSSAEGKTRIRLEPEEAAVKVGDIAYIPVSIVGENGILESNADEKLTIEVRGGELLAFGSANPCTEERYDSGSFTTYQGRALAIVYAQGAGEIRVRVTGRTLGTAEAVIRAAC